MFGWSGGWATTVSTEAQEEVRLRPASAGSVYGSGVSQQIQQHVLVEGLSKHWSLTNTLQQRATVKHRDMPTALMHYFYKQG